jgi:hypothetical protein
MRVPSPQSMQARNDYLDMVLGKLPEIEDKRSASRMNRDQMSDGSTTAMTNSSKA